MNADLMKSLKEAQDALLRIGIKADLTRNIEYDMGRLDATIGAALKRAMSSGLVSEIVGVCAKHDADAMQVMAGLFQAGAAVAFLQGMDDPDAARDVAAVVAGKIIDQAHQTAKKGLE